MQATCRTTTTALLSFRSPKLKSVGLALLLYDAQLGPDAAPVHGLATLGLRCHRSTPGMSLRKYRLVLQQEDITEHLLSPR